MGRKKKVLKKLDNCTKNLIDRREIGYYATPEFISEYLGVRMTEINKKAKTLLDPCCGKEELLPFFIRNKFSIDGMDIIKHKEEYYCNFIKSDFIKYYCDKKNENNLILDYDLYIANPPYNCHEVDFIKCNKNKLKEYFFEVGLHNMYSMFISAIIDLAKDGAIIGLLTYDSFFTSKNHKKLREKILDKCIIHEITMCPTDLFLSQGADVRTSIMILEKKSVKDKVFNNNILINNRPTSSIELRKIFENNIYQEDHNTYCLKDIILDNEKDNLEFVIECPEDIKILFNKKRLGDFFNCITGISTGNDKVYLSKNKQGEYTVPFYKNPAKDRFYSDKILYLHKDFLSFSKEDKNFIVRNKRYLFKTVIACSSMGVEFTASILPENSTYGVNANIVCNENDRWWLVAYLNSTLVTYIVRGVLIRTNMITSGYVSRIPIINLSDNSKEQLSDLAKEVYERRKKKEDIDDIIEKINTIVNKSAGISKESEKIINKFKSNIIKNT